MVTRAACFVKLLCLAKYYKIMKETKLALSALHIIGGALCWHLVRVLVGGKKLVK